MFILETDAAGNCIGIHATPVPLNQWKRNGAYAYEVTQDVYALLVHELGAWVAPPDLQRTGINLCRKVTVTCHPNPVGTNEVVVVTALLPADTIDTEVTFTIAGGKPDVEKVDGSQACHSYVFTAPGTYRVVVSSAHHGSASVEVVVQ